MKKTALFYWPVKGNVEICAKKIKDQFQDESIDMDTIKKVGQYNLADYDLIIVGGSTVGADHWEKASKNNLWFDFFRKFDHEVMKDKPVAIFGLGDQILYPDHFVDGMKIIKDEIDECGAKLVGRWPTEGYEFTGSDSIEENKFLGLALDHDHQEELTDSRIEKWVKQLITEVNL
jgi:flavodoxin I